MTAGLLTVGRERYRDGLQGFWLAQCIANWTGLVTEMDKAEPPFYTDENWEGPSFRYHCPNMRLQ